MSLDVKHIVVGVDGSAGSTAALAWAVAEAEHHDATVTAVLAWTYLDLSPLAKDPDADAPGEEEDQALATLQASLDAARATAGSSRPVDLQPVYNRPVPALVDASRAADLLVVGARGRGGFAGLLLGSVSEQLLEEAHCPVVVVREDQVYVPDGPVVVGVDGSAIAITATHWAAHEATRRGVPLHVVHGWLLPAMTLPPTDRIIAASERDARAVLAEAVDDPLLSNPVMAAPGLTVEAKLLPLGPTAALLESAEDASLIVVGSHGRGRLGRLLLGSTSRQLAHHAPCPLVVFRAGDD